MDRLNKLTPAGNEGLFVKVPEIGEAIADDRFSWRQSAGCPGSDKGVRHGRYTLARQNQWFFTRGQQRR